MSVRIRKSNDVQLRTQISEEFDEIDEQIGDIITVINQLADGGYLLLESGDKLILEDDSGFLLLESVDDSNAVHTGEVTGADVLTVDKTAISNRSTVTVAPTDTILIGDASDSNNLKKIAASDFVASATYDANSIVKADSDNTPIVLAVAEQTLVGRITGGNIDDLSIAQVQTLLLVNPVFTALVPVVADQDYVLWYDAPWAGTVTMVRTDCVSGTCTLTGKVNTTALGGTANSVSTSAQEQSHSSSNTFAKGDKLQFTVSSNSSCLTMSVAFYLTRTS